MGAFAVLACIKQVRSCHGLRVNDAFAVEVVPEVNDHEAENVVIREHGENPDVAWIHKVDRAPWDVEGRGDLGDKVVAMVDHHLRRPRGAGRAEDHRIGPIGLESVVGIRIDDVVKLERRTGEFGIFRANDGLGAGLTDEVVGVFFRESRVHQKRDPVVHDDGPENHWPARGVLEFEDDDGFRGQGREAGAQLRGDLEGFVTEVLVRFFLGFAVVVEIYHVLAVVANVPLVENLCPTICENNIVKF